MICQNEITTLRLTNNENKITNVLNDSTNDIKTELEKKNLPTTMKRNVSGIYKIVNKTNGKYYVGSSSNFSRRWDDHKYKLRRNKHHSPHLQHAWNKHGEDNFEFVIVDSTIPYADLIKEEQKYLDKLNKDTCYNASLIAGRVEFTDEIRKKMSDALKGNKYSVGRVVSEETRKKIGDPQRGRKRPGTGYWQGKKMSEEIKKKMSISRIGKNSWMKGRKHSDKTKEKMKESAKNRKPFLGPFSFQGKCHSEETKRKMSESRKKYYEKRNGLVTSPTI